MFTPEDGKRSQRKLTDRLLHERKKKESILKQSGVLSKMRLRLLLSANSRPAQSKINKNPSLTHSQEERKKISLAQKEKDWRHWSNRRQKKTSLRCKASGNIDRYTTSKRKHLFNQIRITRVVVTTPTRRQRRYLYFFLKNVVGCQHVPWQSKREPIIIYDGEEIQIDTTKKSLTQCAADQSLVSISFHN